MAEDADGGTAAPRGSEAGALQSPWHIIAQHFTALLTAVYLLSAIAGTTYHFFLYRYFGLHVFDYWETGDYLASAVREPRILVFVVLAVLVSSAVIWNAQWDAWARTQGRLAHALLGNLLWEKLGLRLRNQPLVGTLFGMLFFFSLAYSLALEQARALASGTEARVDVYASTFPGGHLSGALISRTSAFVILLDTQTEERYLLPLENVEALHYFASDTASQPDDSATQPAGGGEELPASGPAVESGEPASESTEEKAAQPEA